MDLLMHVLALLLGPAPVLAGLTCIIQGMWSVQYAQRIHTLLSPICPRRPFALLMYNYKTVTSVMPTLSTCS